MEEHVHRLCDTAATQGHDWAAELKSVCVSYTGEEVNAVHVFPLDQVALALPPKAAGANSQAVDRCQGSMAAALSNPEQMFRPAEARPSLFLW